MKPNHVRSPVTRQGVRSVKDQRSLWAGTVSEKFDYAVRFLSVGEEDADLGPLTQMAVTQVGIKVTFAHNPTSRKASTRAFEISWPNSCSLKHDGRDLIIRKMLADSGIEPREPAKDESAAS